MQSCPLHVGFVFWYMQNLGTMSITTLVVLFSAPMLKSPGGVVVRAFSIRKTQVRDQSRSIPGYSRTQIFSLFLYILLPI